MTNFLKDSLISKSSTLHALLTELRELRQIQYACRQFTVFTITTFIFSQVTPSVFHSELNTNPYHHRPFLLFTHQTDSTDYIGPFNVFILLNGCICLYGVYCVRLSRLSLGFRTHLKIYAISFHFWLLHQSFSVKLARPTDYDIQSVRDSLVSVTQSYRSQTDFVLVFV